MPAVAAPERLAADVATKMSLPDLNSELEKRSERMAWLFEKGGDGYDITEDEAGEIRVLNEELAALDQARELKSEYQQMRERAAAELKTQRQPVGRMVHPGSRGTDEAREAGQPQSKSLGEMFTESPEYKAAQHLTRPITGVDLPEVSLKTVMSLSAGWAQEATRGPRVVLSAQRRPMVSDLIPDDPTTENTIRYMEETTFTNNAAAVAEGGTKPEAALAFTERSQAVEVVAVLLPITLQQWEDVPQVRALVNNRLTLMVQLKEEDYLINGTGVSPQILGFLQKPGIQTQAKGTDPTPDAVYKAFTLVRWTGYAEPSAVVFNPTDWQDVRLLRTADGVYIWGSPAEAGLETIWGKPVVVTSAMTLNTALTGDFQLYSHISRRWGLRVDASTEHSTAFAENKIYIRVEERLSLEVYRAAAFAQITGV